MCRSYDAAAGLQWLIKALRQKSVHISWLIPPHGVLSFQPQNVITFQLHSCYSILVWSWWSKEARCSKSILNNTPTTLSSTPVDVNAFPLSDHKKIIGEKNYAFLMQNKKHTVHTVCLCPLQLYFFMHQQANYKGYRNL